MCWPKEVDFEGNARRVAARTFAQSLMQNVIPLLSGFSEREQMEVLAYETERLLLAHHGHLEQATKAYRKVATDTVNCYAKPLISGPQPTHQGETRKNDE